MRTIISLVLLIVFAGCSSTYYKAWEMLGKEKRDLLRSNIQSVSEDQQETQRVFKDALVALRETYSGKETELSRAYARLKGEYEDAESTANNLHARVKKVHSIAEDLFYEWKKEANSIENETLKRASLSKLQDTQEGFSRLSAELKSSEKSIDPVLTRLRDYTLYMKHNLNAQSLGVLRDESKSIQSGIDELVSRMNASTRETERFLESFSDKSL